MSRAAEFALKEPTGDSPWIGPHGRPVEWLELHLTYTCPERCQFCSEDHRMQAFNAFPVTFGRVASVLRTHASRGVKRLHLTGGEPTIHKRFIDVLRLAKKLGMRTSVGTIGTMLARPDFAAAAVPLLDEALFSIHGPTAALHDTMAGRQGSFDRVTSALKTCLDVDPNFNAFVNTVVTTTNVEALPDTIEMADKLGAKLIVVSNLTPEGLGFDQYERLAVDLATLKRVLPQLPARAENAMVRFFGVPMCVLGEHRMLSNDLHWDPRVTVEWASAPGKVVFTDIYTWDPGRKRVHTGPCTDCSLTSMCMGVFDRYTELWPLDALTPMRAPESAGGQQARSEP